MNPLGLAFFALGLVTPVTAGNGCPFRVSHSVGSCRVFACKKSRGPTECSHGKCYCKTGYCKSGHVNSQCLQRVPDSTCHVTRTCYNAGFIETECVKGLCMCKKDYHYNAKSEKCEGTGGHRWFGKSAAVEEVKTKPEPKPDATACMLAVTNGIDELLNAGTYLWSATERCSNTANGVRCASDIFSVVENVLRMSSFMITGMKACAGGKGAKQCELTSLKFGAAASGLTAASLEMSVACKTQTPGAGKKSPLTANANCLPNIAGALTSLGSTIADLTQIKKKCNDNAHCYAATLDTLSAIAHMGECIWQTVEGSCIIDNALAPMNNCVQAMASGAKNLMAIGSSALTVASDCKLLEPTKLYEATGSKVTTVSTFTPLNTGLAALFPLTAVVAFIRGTRDAKKGSAGEHELIEAETAM